MDWVTIIAVFVFVILVDSFLGDYIKDVFGKNKSKEEVFAKLEALEKQIDELNKKLEDNNK